MAKVGLVDTGFSIIPEGRYVFKIIACEYKEKFQKIEVTMKTAKGQTIKESYMLSNDGGRKAFSYMAKVALHDYDITEIDHTDLVGKYISAQVEHTTLPHRDDPNKTVTFANLRDKQEAYAFEQEAETTGTAAPTKSEPAPTTKFKPDLSFLN